MIENFQRNLQKQILFLHGAGQVTKERGTPIATLIAKDYGISSFLFDFSGDGVSSGTLQTSSLKKRINESIATLSSSGFSEQISICAFSMGGHIALELLTLVKVRSLILFYPAIYIADAVDFPFSDSCFTDTIRRERSWETSLVLKNLNTFTENLLIISGDKDTVIPHEVNELILSNAIKAKRKYLITINNAPHVLIPFLIEKKARFDEVCKIIAEFT